MAAHAPSSPARRCSVMIKTEQLRRRGASDELLIQNVTDLFAAARLTVSSASRAVVDAQNALVMAHTWLANALATSETYRREHLRLTELASRRLPLINAPPLALPDGALTQIAQLCVTEARESLERIAVNGGLREARRSARHAAWIYPISMSQVCRRWRTAVLGCPELWAYLENLPPTVYPQLADLVQMRRRACTLDVLWSVPHASSVPTPSDGINHKRWNSLRLVHTSTSESNPPAIPFETSTHFASLTSVSLTASPQKRPPIFSTCLLASMPKLTSISLFDVQFVAPPPYRHPNRMDLTIRYTSIISFRDRDMTDIAIVFPNLHNFSLHIRGPYLNRHRRFLSTSSTSDSPVCATQKLPFTFPALESLDISARDLSHSLVRFQGAFMPCIRDLRLRDNALPTASTFFNHLVRSRAPLVSLGLSDYSPGAIKVFRLHRGIRVLEVPLSLAALSMLQPLVADVPPTAPSPSSGRSSIKVRGEGGSSLAFPSVTKLMLSSPTEDGALKGSVGRVEGATLNGLVEIVRKRNAVVIEMVTAKAVAAGPPLPLPMMFGIEKDLEAPMASAETLVNPSSPVNSPHSTPTISRKPSFAGSIGSSKKRAFSGPAVVPLLEVQFSPTDSLVSRPSSRRGRAAMEQVYNALVDGRKAWAQLGYRMVDS